jgi:hypothetical protein
MTYHASPLCSEFILSFPRNRKEQGLTELLNAKVTNHHLSFGATMKSAKALPPMG